MSEIDNKKKLWKYFAASFGYELNKELYGLYFSYDDFLYDYNDELENAFSNEFADVFGSEFGNEFCSEFGNGFGGAIFTSSNTIGYAFGTNENHYGSSNMFGASLCGEIVNFIGENFTSKILTPSSDIHIDLLANDNWTWILWLSNREDPLSRLFLKTTSNYFIQLAGFNYGYGFDRCNTVVDIFLADKLTGPLSVLSSELYTKIPLMQYMSLIQIEQHEEEFLVTLKRYDPQYHVFVSADNDTISKWLKEKRWKGLFERYNLFPCFSPYANLGIFMRINYKLLLFKNYITIPASTPALIFPEKINNTDFLEFIDTIENTEETVASIMTCVQVKNIVDFIWRCRLQDDSACTKEKIRSEYEELIHDYVSALRKNRKN